VSDLIIEFRNLGLRYGSFQALADVSAQVQQGECVVICGPSGSGKSSLLRCVNGLEPFQEGDVIVRGVSVRNCRDLAGLRAKVGMVFQRFELYPHMTCLQNVALAPRKVLAHTQAEAERKARDVMAKFKVLEQSDKYPAELSGGQQQRVAICRALVLGPEVMLFDEPTSALDPEMVGDVREILGRLASDGMTMLVVTHEMRFAREVADRILFMEHGRIVQRGTAQEFFGDSASPRAKAFLNRVQL
jgi:ABC-type polar amino acid transport system ATPase subunit